MILLTNVLYVQDFSFNLISISKLTFSLKCDLIFSSNECFIKDIKTRDKIGSTELISSLYIFDRSFKHHTSHILNCMVKNFGLWHHRMGHPSDERLKILKTFYPNCYVERSYFCDACHQAKQKKLHFPFNSSQFAQIFYLIHMDI